MMKILENINSIICDHFLLVRYILHCPHFFYKKFLNYLLEYLK
jgi:hypothetical protein